MEQPQRAGVIGLGTMGKPFARNLLGAGFSVTVYNRSRPAVDELAGCGAAAAASPRELAERSDAVVLALPDSPDVAAILHGDDGIFAGAAPGTLIIDMGTISPLAARAFADEARGLGLAYVDAPVSGGPEGARSATLSIMAGGEKDDVARAEPILRTLGSTVVHCGPSGSGQTVKACNQLVIALEIQAISEALLLAQKAGVAADVVLRVLGGGLAANRVLELRGDAMAQHDFAPRGKAAFHRKDLGFVLDLARRVDAVLPATALVDQLFTALVANGRGGWDHTALLSVIEQLSGVGRADRAGSAEHEAAGS